MFLSFLIKQFFALLSYVSNVNSFPKPLSKKEESKLIIELSKGNKDAKDKLIEHNLRLVAHIAKKYSANKESDDLISIGTIGLIKGINSYNCEKGAKLSTYISRCIENEILMYIRSSKKLQNEISLEEPIGYDYEGNQITFNNILCKSDDEVTDTVDTKILVKKMYEKISETLNEREQKIIILRYGLNGRPDMPQREVAKLLGISRSYVSRIEKKALSSLRLALKNDR